MQGRVPVVFVATEPDDWDRIRCFPDQNQPINTATWNKSVVLQKRFIQAVVLRACRLASTPSDMMPSADETNVHWGVLLLLLKDNDHMNCDWLIFVFFMILISLERFPETCWQFGFIFLTLVREFLNARILSDITGTVVPRVDATDAPDRETSQFQCVSFNTGLRGRLCSLYSVRTYTTWWKSFYIRVQLNNEQQSGWCTDWGPSETCRRPSCICALKHSSHLV